MVIITKGDTSAGMWHWEGFDRGRGNLSQSRFELPWVLTEWTEPQMMSPQRHWPRLRLRDHSPSGASEQKRKGGPGPIERTSLLPCILPLWATPSKGGRFNGTSNYPEKKSKFSISKSARGRPPPSHAALSSAHTPLGGTSPPCWVNFLHRTAQRVWLPPPRLGFIWFVSPPDTASLLTCFQIRRKPVFSDKVVGK